jgi:endonuclease YncB( thermonuclease family)
MSLAVRGLSLVLIVVTGLAVAHASEISGRASVQEDGSLRVDGRPVRLYGIHVPPSGETCRSFERPVMCNTHAALALDFKISGDFVHCDPVQRLDYNTVSAVCRVGDDDLAAYLLERGWALATPDAPFEYVALERIARHRGFGVWGLPGEVRRRTD